MDWENDTPTGRRFSGKIMVSAIGILVAACLLVVLFHAYGHWCSRRAALRRLRSRRQRSISTSAAAIGAELGLDVLAMNSLPMFSYDSKTRVQGSPLECAVCLSEFEEGETGRILPGCHHCFHIDCIDMWLLSHCLCPLCRTPVHIRPGVDPAHEITIPVIATGPEPHSGSSSAPDPEKNEAAPDPDIESGAKPASWIGSCVKQVV
ncbi:RING-H2 finger protein ATL2-like [Andrographis paniculata]|uniref:RING-H2 finger protein ATL2-like n=1 Tax=Andrographis paniculata TaxID=175694 RepID=UPI0021E82788|nr:RING-H2 finger protein ATL2-like [Andrographis paniculata]